MSKFLNCAYYVFGHSRFMGEVQVHFKIVLESNYGDHMKIESRRTLDVR